MTCVLNKWVPNTSREAESEGWRGSTASASLSDDQLIQLAFTRGPDLDHTQTARAGELALVYVEGDRVKAHYKNFDDGQFDLIYWTEKQNDCG